MLHAIAMILCGNSLNSFFSFKIFILSLTICSVHSFEYATDLLIHSSSFNFISKISSIVYSFSSLSILKYSLSGIYTILFKDFTYPFNIATLKG